MPHTAPARSRFAGLLALALLGAACGSRRVPLPQFPEPTSDAARVARGEYIVRNVAVCGHCHAADPRNDPDGPLSGGLEFANWRIGTVRASNLTPDVETGIGAWSEAEIVRAVRNGQHRDGRLLSPVMPYEWFHGMSAEDALAVARYLKSLPPVRNEVRQDPNLVFAIADALFLRPKEEIRVVAPPRAPTAQYGAHLAQHVALCADCHTPRRGLRATPDRHRLFAGNPDPPEGFPENPSNLTPHHETGIGSWSEEEFLRTIRTGVNPAGRELHEFMPWPRLGRMTDDDLRAIYRYLRRVPPVRQDVSRPRKD